MLERVTDYRRIKRLAPWKLVASSEIIYLIAVDRGVDVGVICFEALGGHLSMHVELQYRGKKAAQSCRDAISWVFQNTDWDIIHAEIPEEYRNVHYMATHVGFEFCGIQDKLRTYSVKREIFRQEAA